MKMTALVLLSSLFFSVHGFSHETPRSVNEELREKIVKLVDRPDLSSLRGNKFHAEIEFIVTRQNQVLVLAVYTDNTYLDEYIKGRLNYRHVGLKGAQKLRPYRISMSFVKP